MTYRIFTNDRRTVRGIQMYSALKEVEASSVEEALNKCSPLSSVVAIRWPESAQSDDEKKWLKKHVG